nr:molybdate ABC transporter substrate-binding protein [Aestuariimicrobium ganziense]
MFAAASLNTAFDEVAVEYKKAHPGVEITFNYLGSQDLVQQMQGGAAADVFASADQKNMTIAIESKLISGGPKVFATNTLVLIVPRDPKTGQGNSAGITGLDASLDGKKLVICAPAVPCGATTATLASNLGVTLKPVSEEQKVTDVRGKVESGEADAGLVYSTDAKQAGDKVETIQIPGAEKVVNSYPIAVTASSRAPAEAQSFVDFVASEAGQAVLEKYGFGKP